MTSAKDATYPDMIGNVIRANEPAEANHPSKIPCGFLPTTAKHTNCECWGSVCTHTERLKFLHRVLSLLTLGEQSYYSRVTNRVANGINQKERQKVSPMRILQPIFHTR